MRVAWRAVRLAGVAGVSTPAFVERSRVLLLPPLNGGVAGVSTPAFVERGNDGSVASFCRWCSRGFNSGLR